ncbi:MAG: hypothetical protein DMG40_03570 [Acidobacteria bacterium]|nr:MAG: hypothetical protein DMG40_03570 [Acidobacteriota bacterium]
MFKEPYTKRLDTWASAREWLQAAGLSLTIALLVAAPFFRMGIMVGHDFAFHMTSWMDVAQQWKQGICYPRWTEWANGGFGEPRFIFYPPLSWLLGAALSFVAPWKGVEALFVVVVQALAGVSMYAVARRFLSQGGALLASVLYAANPYIFLDIYLRSAFGEQIACAWLPLAVLGALPLAGLAADHRRPKLRTAAFFALAFAAIWASDVPVGVMASYAVALIFVWGAIVKKAWEPLWRGAAGLALGFGLAGFYLLPVAYEQHWINTRTLIPEGAVPTKHFLYAQPYWDVDFPKMVSFNWTASTVGILILVVVVIAAIAVRRRLPRDEQNSDLRALWHTLLALSAAATFLLLHLSWPLWQYLPKLAFVQFPWRWLAVLALVYAFFLALAIERSRRRGVWTAATLIVLTGGSAAYIVHSGRSEGRWVGVDVTPSMHQDFIDDDNGFLGTPEYFPGGARYQSYFSSHLPAQRPRVQILPAEGSRGGSPKAKFHIEKWTAEDREVQVDAQEPVQLALRLLRYPAWQVELNGRVTTPERSRALNQIVLPVPAGVADIRVSFRRTPDRLAGIVLSLVIFLTVTAILLFAWLFEKKTVWNVDRGIIEPTSFSSYSGDQAP